MNAAHRFRRVVVGLGENGKSRVLVDGPVLPMGPTAGLAWYSDTVPADNSGTADIAPVEFSFELMHSGASVFTIVAFAPGEPAFWHATDSIDYIVVLEGAVTIEVETGEAKLEPGDFLVDRGVMHSWRNDGPETCVIAVVALPAEPVGKGRTV